MSTETAKKRKRDGRADEEGNGGGVVGMEKIVAEMKAQMMRMQNELDDTKSRSKNEMDEMKSRSASMQNEMDGVKRRLPRVDELERKCQSLAAGLANSREKCKSLEARCESLERSMQILAKDTKWEYSAPVIPASHWIDRGFDEIYIERMELLFLRTIKVYTCELRRGACSEDIRLGGRSGANDPVLLHDDALLPHWREFANALHYARIVKLLFDLPSTACNSHLH